MTTTKIPLSCFIAELTLKFAYGKITNKNSYENSEKKAMRGAKPTQMLKHTAMPLKLKQCGTGT